MLSVILWTQDSQLICPCLTTVDHDVAHLQPLTKDDLRTFYTRYIDPSSTATRAKLSVHMIAQGRASTDADAEASAVKAELQLAVSQYLSSKGISTSSHAKLDERFTKLDLPAQGVPAILATVRAYLAEDLAIAAHTIQEILTEGEKFLSAIIPGVDSATASDKAIPDEHSSSEAKPSTIMIKDVHAFKAGLMVTKGAQPVKPLVEYEETESKL